MAKKTEKKPEKKCRPCTMLVVAERAARSAKTCDAQQKAVTVFREVAAAKIASRFTSKAEKERLFGSVQRLETRAAMCGKLPTAPVVTAARMTAEEHAAAAVKRAMEREAAAEARAAAVAAAGNDPSAMNGLYGHRRHRSHMGRYW